MASNQVIPESFSFPTKNVNKLVQTEGLRGPPVGLCLGDPFGNPRMLESISNESLFVFLYQTYSTPGSISMSFSSFRMQVENRRVVSHRSCVSKLTKTEKKILKWRGSTSAKRRKITLTFMLSSYTLLGTGALIFVDNAITHNPSLAHTLTPDKII